MEQKKSPIEMLQIAREYADALIARNEQAGRAKHWDSDGLENCQFCFGRTLGRYGLAESATFWCTASI